MSPITLTNPIIPRNSLILVTGVNGLIASHIVDQLLAAGYRVRGTVRDKAKSAWVTELFASRHTGPDRFELVQVSDLTAPDVWPSAVAGVAGIIAVAAGVDLADARPLKEQVDEGVRGVYPLLQAARESPTVKSFVYTSSVWAAWDPKAGTPVTVGEWSYNEEAVRIAEDETVSVEEKGIRPFMAGRVLVEKKVWEWVKKEKPGFKFNSVLPDMVMGPILVPDKQSASTAGYVRGLWEGDERAVATVRHIAPQWFIDARDNGRLFVAALVTPGVEGERVFGCAGRFSFPMVVEILRREFPRKEGLPVLEDVGEDMTVMMPRERALELLRSVGQEEWTPLEQSVRDLVESFGGK